MKHDQSFSAHNFRTIIRHANKRGVYLEGAFFPEVEKLSQGLRLRAGSRRLLVMQKSAYQSEELQEFKTALSEEIRQQQDKKETKLFEELEAISTSINSRSFAFGIRQIDVGKGKKAFVTYQNAETYFALKQLQQNVRNLYQVKQSDRHQIVCQLRELLRGTFPTYVLRTDVSSFYESIPSKNILAKIRTDRLLTARSRKLIEQILKEYWKLIGNDIGVPRGIGISAYLAEIYMRDFDRTIRATAGVVYYARYVDDIVVIYSRPPNTTGNSFRKVVETAIAGLGLCCNPLKTDFFEVGGGRSRCFEYLGYKFKICSDSVNLCMTDKKRKRYMRRIDKTFGAYGGNSKQRSGIERKARALLEKRVRFLTGNTRLVNRKKNVVTGIFFSNALLSDWSDLVELDKYLRAKISRLGSTRLRKRLTENSFRFGFKARRYHKFSPRDLSEIVEVWRHVP